MTLDGSSRRGYLDEVVAILWPPPARGHVGRGHGHGTGELVARFVLVPDASRPRLLVPEAAPRAAAAAVRRYTAHRSPRMLLGAGLLAAIFATGMSSVLLRDRLRVYRPAGGTAGTIGTIETYLRGALGRDLLLSLHIGRPRANRKPVLHALRPDGESLGFVKVGINPLTSELVRAEAEALRTLGRAGLRAITVPGVLHHGRWNDLEILVQSALPVWGARARDGARDGRRLAAMRELAEIRGVRTEPADASSYPRRLARRLGDVPDREAAGVVRGAIERAVADGEPLPMGAWHGDWTPWNMAVTPDSVLVWDWERFALDVPVGFDALHYVLQELRAGGVEAARRGAEHCIQRAPDILGPFGLAAPAARRVAVLYLAEIATRYLLDDQAEAGARLGRLDRWLLPVLSSAEANPKD
ncbi:MAG: phosphotransferase [Streptosporangiales bacterium]|nr:phosphotransferase [Streptosporangiales bacterium]